MAQALDELWGVLSTGNLLDAEVQVAGLLALPALNRGTRADAQEFVGALIAAAARKQPASSAAAFYRLLMALGAPSVKKMASGALREVTSSGVYPPSWVTEKLATGVGVPGSCWASCLLLKSMNCAPAPSTMPLGCGLEPFPALPEV